MGLWHELFRSILLEKKKVHRQPFLLSVLLSHRLWWKLWSLLWCASLTLSQWSAPAPEPSYTVPQLGRSFSPPSWRGPLSCCYAESQLPVVSVHAGHMPPLQLCGHKHIVENMYTSMPFVVEKDIRFVFVQQAYNAYLHMMYNTLPSASSILLSQLDHL